MLVDFLPRFLTERAPTSRIHPLTLQVRGRKIWRPAILFAGKIARQRFFGSIKKITSGVEYNSIDTYVFIPGIQIQL